MSKRHIERVVSHELSGAAKRKQAADGAAYVKTLPKINEHFPTIPKDPVPSTSVSSAPAGVINPPSVLSSTANGKTSNISLTLNVNMN